MYVAAYARDLPGASERRAATLEAHRVHLDTAADGLAIRASGPMIEDGTMCGSLFIYEAPDLASVRAFMARDPMVLANVYARVELCEFDWRRGAPT